MNAPGSDDSECEEVYGEDDDAPDTLNVELENTTEAASWQHTQDWLAKDALCQPDGSPSPPAPAPAPAPAHVVTRAALEADGGLGGPATIEEGDEGGGEAANEGGGHDTLQDGVSRTAAVSQASAPGHGGRCGSPLCARAYSG